MEKISILFFTLFLMISAFGQRSVKSETENNPVFYDNSGANAKVVCDEFIPSNAFENGFPCSSANAYKSANDVTVNADENFVLNQITANIFTLTGNTITAVDVIYYDDNSGLPGTQIGTETGLIPESQSVIGNSSGYDIHLAVIDVTAFTFLGQEGVPTTYWIELSVTDNAGSTDIYWELTTIDSNGNPYALYDEGWEQIIDGDGVYTFSGVCLPICNHSNLSNDFEDGLLAGSSTSYKVANDLIVNSDEKFILEQITANILDNNTITSVDIFYYTDDGGFPGTEIGNEAAVVPTSQTIIGNNYGLDIHEIVLDLTPFTFLGQAGIPVTYWVELSVTDDGGSNDLYWEMTSATFQGNNIAYVSSVGGPWEYYTGFDGVYIFSGQCELLGADIEIITKDNVSLYPNPSNGQFNISINLSEIESADLEIINMQGQVIAEFNNIETNKVHTIDLGNKAKGLYFVRISSVNGTVLKKLTLLK